MEDFFEGSLRFFLRGVYWLGRFALFLAWDLSVEIIGWSIGWLICRIFTFNHFPKEPVTEQQKASFATAIFVEIVGILALFTLLILFGSWLGIAW